MEFALPRSLVCLTLEHNINDPGTVEGYFSIEPEATEYCVPIALRNVLNRAGAKYGIPSISMTAESLLKNLRALWSEGGLIYKAIQYDTPHILAYYLTLHGPLEVPGEIIQDAARENAINVVRFILDQWRGDLDTDMLFKAIGGAANRGYDDVVEYLLSQMPSNTMYTDEDLNGVLFGMTGTYPKVFESRQRAYEKITNMLLDRIRRGVNARIVCSGGNYANIGMLKAFKARNPALAKIVENYELI